MYIRPITNYNYNQRNNQQPRQFADNKLLTSVQNNPKHSDKSSLVRDKYVTPNITFKASYNISKKVELQKAAETILKRSIVFGPEEYKMLKPEELSKLREYGEIFKDSDSEIINFILDFGKYFSKRIHEKYPDGFIFVSVGRSPAFLGKHLEFEGEQAMYCPISGLRTYRDIDYSPEFLRLYKTYLNSIGLTKELAQTTQKTIIITDYTHEGTSLDHFRDLLARHEFGIKEGEKVKYSPITWSVNDNFLRKNCIFEDSPFLIDKLRPNRWDFDDYLYKDIMIGSRHKKYTSIPRIYARGGGNFPEKFNNYFQDGNKFKEDFDVKMVNFLTADSIHKK